MIFCMAYCCAVDEWIKICWEFINDVIREIIIYYYINASENILWYDFNKKGEK